MDKIIARSILSGIRADISKRDEKETRITELCGKISEGFGKIFIYVSMGAEVSTKRLIDMFCKDKTLYVPHTCKDMTMHAVKPYLPVDFSAVDKRGNVDADCSTLYDGQADLTIVPLLGFDRSCHRLGYGAGCYDRYFARFPQGKKVGLAFAEQECEIEFENKDIPLDIIITPDGIIRR